MDSVETLLSHSILLANLVRSHYIYAATDCPDITSALEGFSESLSKELPSEWNIHITIIEPGGIRTEWNKGNMIKATPHPAYAGPNTPSTKFAPLFEVEYPGDPGKGASCQATCVESFLTKHFKLQRHKL